jgi:ATP-dependent protease Clp ATPase subunit
VKELLRGLSSQDIRQQPDFHKVEPDYRTIDEISNSLQGTIFGQEKACNQLARAVTRSMAGFSDPRRPEGTFMFLGPTGVGKTEMGKALAKYLYGDKWEKRFLRVDCTQLQESHSVGRLKGSEPSYVGYGDNNILITPDFLNRGGIVLFDEIEKAHPVIWRWLLPVMEEGQQKALVPKGDGGRYSSELAELNFANTYLIMTANVGADKLHKAKLGQGLGFHIQNQSADLESIGMTELRKAFEGMPEFLGRLDSTVVFQDLERPQYERIFNKFIDEINADQRGGQNYLAVTHELRDYVLDHAATGQYGAREIRHAINQHILDKAAEIKFSGVLKSGQPLIGDWEDSTVIFWTSDLHEATPPPAITKVPSAVVPRDSGSYIGNRSPEVEEPPTDHKAPLGKFTKRPKPPEPPESIDIPPESVTNLYDVQVTNEDGSTEYICGVDKVFGDMWLENFGDNPEFRGKTVSKAKLVPHTPKGINFFVPTEPPTHTVDIAITVHTPLGDKMNVIENLPLMGE